MLAERHGVGKTRGRYCIWRRGLVVGRQHGVGRECQAAGRESLLAQSRLMTGRQFSWQGIGKGR